MGLWVAMACFVRGILNRSMVGADAGGMMALRDTASRVNYLDTRGLKVNYFDVMDLQ